MLHTRVQQAGWRLTCWADDEHARDLLAAKSVAAQTEDDPVLVLGVGVLVWPVHQGAGPPVAPVTAGGHLFNTSTAVDLPQEAHLPTTHGTDYIYVCGHIKLMEIQRDFEDRKKKVDRDRQKLISSIGVRMEEENKCEH